MTPRFLELLGDLPRAFAVLDRDRRRRRPRASGPERFRRLAARVCCRGTSDIAQATMPIVAMASATTAAGTSFDIPLLSLLRRAAGYRGTPGGLSRRPGRPAPPCSFGAPVAGPGAALARRSCSACTVESRSSQSVTGTLDRGQQLSHELLHALRLLAGGAVHPQRQADDRRRRRPPPRPAPLSRQLPSSRALRTERAQGHGDLSVRIAYRQPDAPLTNVDSKIAHYESFSRLDLLRRQLLRHAQRLVESRRIATARLRHLRPAAAAAAGHLRRLLDQLAGVQAAGSPGRA